MDDEALDSDWHSVVYCHLCHIEFNLVLDDCLDCAKELEDGHANDGP